MTPLVLTLRRRPDQRLDMSPLVPQRLAGKRAAEIGKINALRLRKLAAG